MSQTYVLPYKTPNNSGTQLLNAIKLAVESSNTGLQGQLSTFPNFFPLLLWVSIGLGSRIPVR